MIDTYRNKPNLPDEDGPEFIYGADEAARISAKALDEEKKKQEAKWNSKNIKDLWSQEIWPKIQYTATANRDPTYNYTLIRIIQSRFEDIKDYGEKLGYNITKSALDEYIKISWRLKMPNKAPNKWKADPEPEKPDMRPEPTIAPKGGRIVNQGGLTNTQFLSAILAGIALALSAVGISTLL